MQMILYQLPNKNSQITGYIFGESYLKVLDCSNNWVYIKKGINEGWLAPEFICTNPVTNCN